MNGTIWPALNGTPAERKMGLSKTTIDREQRGLPKFIETVEKAPGTAKLETFQSGGFRSKLTGSRRGSTAQYNEIRAGMKRASLIEMHLDDNLACGHDILLRFIAPLLRLIGAQPGPSLKAVPA